MRLRDGDGEVRLPGGMASRIRYSRLGSREIRCGARRPGDPDGKIQGAVERLDETAMALVFPIPVYTPAETPPPAAGCGCRGAAPVAGLSWLAGLLGLAVRRRR